nr:SGNH/GDSL hydrolase family protein [Petropleomorpha daqingensis]
MVLACLTGCRPVDSASTNATLSVFAVGDSITEADSPDFDDGDLGSGSWAWYTDQAPVLMLGGWAHAGATTADMLLGVSELVAESTMRHADVLVLMAGSNDVDAGVPFAEAADHLRAIARDAGISRVVLSTIPPEDAVAADVQAFNAQLPALARSEGWQLVDPMTQIRDGGGHYAPGMTDDGVHPTVRAARLIGQALHRDLVR